MSLSDLFQQKRVVSLEVFPPKPDAPIDVVLRTLEALADLQPDYMSVTYGAGGSKIGLSCELAQSIPVICHCPALAHLTCVGADEARLQQTLEAFARVGVEAVLALRGDVPAGMTYQQAFAHFHYASDLVQYIKAHTNLCVGAACYPESHFESPTPGTDLDNLKYKVDCGVDFLVSQLFFDNDAFFSFLDRARRAGIQVPITAGVMPVLNAPQILRMTTLCGSSIPASLSRIYARYGENKEDFQKAGMDFCCQQILDLKRGGVDGIHLYTMNRAKSTRAILMRTALR